MVRTITRDEELKMLDYLDVDTSFKDDFGLSLIDWSLNKSDIKCLRNVLGFLLMLDAGLRVGEAVRLTYSDCYFANQPVRILCLPAKICKGKKPREIPVTNRLSAALLRFITQPLLIPESSSYQALLARKPRGRAFTTRTLERVITAAALAAIGRHITPHVLRHTFATKLMKKTDMRTVQELLGHSCLTSTQVYTHPNDDDKRRAIDDLNAP